MATLNVKEHGAIGDGKADDTQALKNVFAQGSGNTVYLPKGTFNVKGTLWVPSNTVIEGESREESIIKLVSGHTLDPVLFRDTNIYPIISTNDNSENITFRNFYVKGETTRITHKEEWGVGGILFQKTKIGLAENVSVRWINITADLVGYGYGFGITTLDADNIEYSNCEGEYTGYQNFGFFDRTTNSQMHDCFSGMGHRTSTQVHRSCNNIRIYDNTIIQVPNPATNEPHGAVTIHGRPGVEEAKNVIIEDNVIEMSGGQKAAVQAFQESENLIVRNNTIKSNGEGVRVGLGVGALIEGNTIISQKETNTPLEYGNIGVNIIENSTAIVRNNSVQGFDKDYFADSTSTMTDGDTPSLPPGGNLYTCKIYQNVNGKIVEVEPVITVNGVARKVKPFIRR